MTIKQLTRITLLAATVVAGTAGCGLLGASTDTGSPTPAPTGPASATPTAGASQHPTPAQSKQPTPAKTSSTPKPSGPQIVYFRVKQKPECPKGTTQFLVPAVPLVIEWKVTGADKVALSVDSPGLVGGYGTYGLEQAMSFTFSCGGAPGTTETHQYTIHTVGGGTQRSQTLKPSAVVNEIAQV